MADIQVILNEKVQWATAVLAASNWPTVEQEQRPHAVHPHTKQTRQFVTSFGSETAVSLLNDGLMAEKSIDALLTDLVNEASLDSFAKSANIEAFFTDHAQVWETAVAECTDIFASCPLPHMIEQMGGDTTPIKIMPTLVYPMLNPAVISFDEYTLILLPPPKAYGESPPWPYKEDPIWVVVEAAKAILKYALQPIFQQTTEADQQKIIQAGVSICLEKMFDDFERQAYIVRIKKEEKIQELPQISNDLRDWLAEEKSDPVTHILKKNEE